MKWGIFFSMFLLVAGCASYEQAAELDLPANAPKEVAEVTLPIDEYFERATFKVFGQYVSDRFTGYHVGDDIEYTDVAEDVPVYAMADGEVTRAGWVSGYGGLLVIRHTVDEQTITALYGHIDLSSATVEVGDSVTRGQFLANLGDGETSETDGERKHLHFALYEGEDGRINGYESSEAGVSRWLNPRIFLRSTVFDKITLVF